MLLKLNEIVDILIHSFSRNSLLLRVSPDPVIDIFNLMNINIEDIDNIEDAIPQVLLNMLDHKLINVDILSWMVTTSYKQTESLLRAILNHELINGYLLCRLAQNPNSSSEFLIILFNHELVNFNVLYHLARNPNASTDLLRAIFDHEFINEDILYNITENPNASADLLMAALKSEYLNDNVLFNVARHRNADSYILMCVLNMHQYNYDYDILSEYIDQMLLTAILNNYNANSLDILVAILLESRLSQNLFVEENINYILVLQSKMLEQLDLHENANFTTFNFLLDFLLDYFSFAQLEPKYSYNQIETEILQLIIKRNNELIFMVSLLLNLIKNTNLNLTSNQSLDRGDISKCQNEIATCSKELSKYKIADHSLQINLDVLINILQFAFGQHLLQIIPIFDYIKGKMKLMYKLWDYLEKEPSKIIDLTSNNFNLINIALNHHTISVPRDGNCFYHAVLLHLPQDANNNVEVLRNLVADIIEEELQNNTTNNAENYRQMILAEGFNEVEYINQVRISNIWADHLQIIAMMRALRRPVYIIDNNNVIINTMDIEILGQNINFGEQIFVYYNGYNHYDGILYQDHNIARIMITIVDNSMNTGKYLIPIQHESNNYKCIDTPYYILMGKPIKAAKLAISANNINHIRNTRSLSYDDRINRLHVASSISSKVQRRYSI